MALLQLTEEQIRTWTREQKDEWWLHNVYRGDMPQLTLRSALTGFLLGGVLAATAMYIGAKTGISIGVGISISIGISICVGIRVSIRISVSISVGIGVSVDRARNHFEQVEAEGLLDATRAVVVTDDPEVDALISGTSRTVSVHASDIVTLAPGLTLTLSGRYNDTRVRTVDVGRATLGLDTELDGAVTRDTSCAPPSLRAAAS